MAAQQEIEILLKMKADLDQGLGQSIKGLQSIETETKKVATNSTASLKKLEGGFDTTASSAGHLADTVGRTATTMARSASAFGLPAEALRTLDDVMDVTELGMNNLSKSAAGFNAASIGVAGAGLAVGTAIGTWLRTFPAVSKAADDLAMSLQRIWTGIETADSSAGLKKFSAEIAKTNEEAIKRQVEQQKTLGATTEQLAKTYKTITPELAEQLGFGKKQLDVIKEQRRESEAWAKHRRDTLDIEGQIADVVRNEQLEIEKRNKLAARIMGPPKELMGELEEIQILTNHTAQFADKFVTGLETSNKEAAKLSLTMGKWPSVMASSGTSLKENLGKAFHSLPQVILGAIQGGGSIFKSAGASIFSSMFSEGSEIVGKLTKGLSGALGKGLGGALGSIIPGLGTLLGSGLGGLADKLFGKIFGKGEIKKVNDMRDAFFQAHGGFEKLSRELAKTGDAGLVKKIFDAKTVEEFNALMDEANSKLALQGEAQQKVNDAMERYGISIDEMGPRFAAQELDKKALSLYEDYQLLIGAGADVVTINEKMGPALSSYVDTAVKAGVTIPESMRSVIDSMYAQGTLLHENGEAFTEAEYKGLSFAQTMDEQFKTLIASISDLVAALTGVPNVTRTVTTVHRDEYQGGGGGGGQEPQFARGGVVLPFRRAASGVVTGGPTRVLMGEAGPEVAAPVAALFGKLGDTIAAKVAAVSGGGDISVYIGSEQVTAHVVRGINTGRGGQIKGSRIGRG